MKSLNIGPEIVILHVLVFINIYRPTTGLDQANNTNTSTPSLSVSTEKTESNITWVKIDTINPNSTKLSKTDNSTIASSENYSYEEQSQDLNGSRRKRRKRRRNKKQNSIPERTYKSSWNQPRRDSDSPHKKYSTRVRLNKPVQFLIPPDYEENAITKEPVAAAEVLREKYEHTSPRNEQRFLKEKKISTPARYLLPPFVDQYYSGNVASTEYELAHKKQSKPIEWSGNGSNRGATKFKHTIYYSDSGNEIISNFNNNEIAAERPQDDRYTRIEVPSTESPRRYAGVSNHEFNSPQPRVEPPRSLVRVVEEYTSPQPRTEAPRQLSRIVENYSSQQSRIESPRPLPGDYNSPQVRTEPPRPPSRIIEDYSLQHSQSRTEPPRSSPRIPEDYSIHQSQLHTEPSRPPPRIIEDYSLQQSQSRTEPPRLPPRIIEDYSLQQSQSRTEPPRSTPRIPEDYSLHQSQLHTEPPRSSPRILEDYSLQQSRTEAPRALPRVIEDYNSPQLHNDPSRSFSKVIEDYNAPQLQTEAPPQALPRVIEDFNSPQLHHEPSKSLSKVIEEYNVHLRPPTESPRHFNKFDDYRAPPQLSTEPSRHLSKIIEDYASPPKVRPASRIIDEYRLPDTRPEPFRPANNNQDYRPVIIQSTAIPFYATTSQTTPNNSIANYVTQNYDTYNNRGKSINNFMSSEVANAGMHVINMSYYQKQHAQLFQQNQRAQQMNYKQSYFQTTLQPPTQQPSFSHQNQNQRSQKYQQPPIQSFKEVQNYQNIQSPPISSTQIAEHQRKQTYNQQFSQPSYQTQTPYTKLPEIRATTPFPVTNRSVSMKDEYQGNEFKGLEIAESKYFSDLPSEQLFTSLQNDGQVIPGVAGKDYPVIDQNLLHKGRFSCRGLEGYFADVSSRCQVFYICNGNGAGEPMLCPNGTLFSQELLVCDWWYNVDC